MTSRYYGGKISGCQHSFALFNDGRKVRATVLFLSAIMHRKVIHVNFFAFFLAIFAVPRFVEIQEFYYHGIVT